mmetsp:Transcript_77436/g.250531  ORF Transcript_77436/g.250531 Transcript_77436/m.250531 type:complete len:142 (+) Transcript_77436:69-494(+)
MTMAASCMQPKRRRQHSGVAVLLGLVLVLALAPASPLHLVLGPLCFASAASRPQALNRQPRLDGTAALRATGGGSGETPLESRISEELREEPDVATTDSGGTPTVSRTPEQRTFNNPIVRLLFAASIGMVLNVIVRTQLGL